MTENRCKSVCKKIKIVLQYFINKSSYFNENIVLNVEDIKRHQECNNEKEIADIINGLCDENYLTKNENDTYQVTIKGFQYYLTYKICEKIGSVNSLIG